MKIIISKYFEKNYIKKNRKYFVLHDLLSFIKTKNHTFIDLHSPFLKTKMIFENTHFRGIIVLRKKEVFIPVCIFPKKDKKFPENLSWKTHKNFISDEFDTILENMEKGEFEVF